MSSEVTAAIIAGSVGIVTVVATVIVQTIGFRATRANIEQQIKATHKDTADTLGHQREQLDRTLAEQRTRTLNERFATAAEQLGSDKPAVRLAGVYAISGLADDWEENRQTCVDVLCAYLRMPYEPDPGQDVPEPQRLAFRAIREVRHTVIRVITAHLKSDAAVSWQGLNFDFRGVVFDGGDFRHAEFSGGTVSFGGPSSPTAYSASTPPGSPAAQSTSTPPGSPAAQSTSTAPGSLVAQSTSAAPSSLAAQSTSTAPGSLVARSTSAAPSFPAAQSISTAPRSSTSRPTWAGPSSPAGRLTSAALQTGQRRLHSLGRIHRPRV
jgi:hypothetical protein